MCVCVRAYLYSWSQSVGCERTLNGSAREPKAASMERAVKKQHPAIARPLFYFFSHSDFCWNIIARNLLCCSATPIEWKIAPCSHTSTHLFGKRKRLVRKIGKNCSHQKIVIWISLFCKYKLWNFDHDNMTFTRTMLWIFIYIFFFWIFHINWMGSCIICFMDYHLSFNFNVKICGEQENIGLSGKQGGW